MRTDSHTHLGKHLSEALLNDGCVAVNAANEREWQSVLNLHSAGRCFPFIGIHPWFIDRAEDGWMERLSTHLKESVAGVGEVGLDRFRGPSMDEQETALRGQLDLAVALHRPVSLHCVKRWGQLLGILAHYAPLNRRFMVHGFTGSVEVMNQLIDLGCMVSVGFDSLDPDSTLGEVWRELPLEHALLESDAPDGLQRSHLLQRGIGYAAGMTMLYDAAAQQKCMEYEALSAQIDKNLKLFIYG